MDLRKLSLLLLMGAGFVACSDQDDPQTPSVQKEADTFVTLSVNLPRANSTRALPGDYNQDGTYEGVDGVETLDVYMMDGEGIIEAKRFTGTDISSTGSSVSPSQPFRTTSGYKTVYVVLNNPAPLGTTITTEHELVKTTGLARTKTVNGVEYDVITMTGKASNVYIAPDVPVQDATTGVNKIPVEVNRLASRVIVTTTASSKLIDADTSQEIGSVSNVTYSVAQGTNKVYWIGQADYETWGSEYVPVLGEYVGQADTYYDYADLSTPTAVPTKPVAGEGYKAMKGKFLFENTHKEGTRETTGYRKGNTAYVLVRAKFTPNANAIADGGTLTNGTFYVGQADGKIYSSKAAAQAAVQNQKVMTYVEGKMLNYAWLNPDDVVTPMNSPVVRNNIYHVNITGFKRLAYNWNPLYPEDPDTTNPQNPDPKPGPEEPEIPIDPIDPLTPEQTFMSVEVTVQDWTVHTYDIEF